MYQLLFCVLLPWTAIAASPKSDEYAASQRKNTTQFFGAARVAKKKDAAASEPERHVRASVAVESDGQTQTVDTPPALRVEGVPADKRTPGIPKMAEERDDNHAAVPKIIHFMYKQDLSRPGTEWPNPVWKVAYAQWQKHFPEPEYMYRFWTDSAIDRLFKDSCSQHYSLFTTYTKEIYKSDLSRYCILREIGGIYADLDYEPRANFYNDLKPGRVSLIQSPYDHEDFQNALMAAPQGGKFNDYWNGLLDLAELKRQFNEGPVEATGPKLLDNYPPNDDNAVVNVLSCKHYQRKIHQDAGAIKKGCGYLNGKEDADKVKGIHWGTVSWNGMQAGVLADDLQGENNHRDTARLFKNVHPEAFAEQAMEEKVPTQSPTTQ
jgi:hypothetical protein